MDEQKNDNADGRPPQRVMKPLVHEWLSAKNIAFVVISFLTVWAIERCATTLHGHLVTPAYDKFLQMIGWQTDPKEAWPLWKKVLCCIFEMIFTLLILLVASKYFLGHNLSLSPGNPEIPTPQVVHIHVHQGATEGASPLRPPSKGASPLIPPSTFYGRQTVLDCQ